jgi:1-acyl-sn-glycerol-3-phosphate acyltransferase
MLKALLYVRASLQVALIFIWTAISGIIGILLMLVTWNGQWVHYFEGRYLFCPPVLAIARVKIKVVGLENIDYQRPCIFVSNHVSHLDVVAIARAIPIGLFYIGKKELKRVPVLGQYMYVIGHIFIDRKNREKAMISMRKAASIIAAGKSVITFPEGTRSKDGKIGVFKRGTFIIAQEGKIDIMPENILPRDAFIIQPGTIEVRIGKRIEAKEFDGLNAEQTAELVRSRVAQLISSSNS